MTSPATAPATPDRRLHPWSWLFVLLQQLRQFLLPLVALVVFGSRGDRGDLADLLVPLVAVAVLVAISLLQYLTYRYRIGGDALTVRSGWLQRSVREIPFARIHNVVVHQSPLHRLFGVAEVRLESAGGNKPEAQMRVLRLDDALALEHQVRHRGPEAGEAAGVAPPAAEVLLALSPAEVVRLGLISNRGMVVAAAAFGALYQMFPRRLASDYIQDYSQRAFGYASHLHPGTAVAVVAAVAMALLALAALRVLSVLLALLQYHGFVLSRAERRLTVERGLLTRLRTSVAQRRIQAWTLQEGVMHRLLRRRRLRIDTAVVEAQGESGRALKELAPVATPAACDRLVAGLLPVPHWPPRDWRGVARGQWWRLCLPTLVLLPALVALLCWHYGSWGLLPLLWLPWSAFKARRQVARMGYALDERLIAVRGGWWNRWWRFAELDKLQALQLVRSPLDRLLGTATLWLDTAGASAGAPPLRLQFVAEDDARAIQQRLIEAMARRRLRW